MNVRDKIAGFLRGGQDRRAWLDEQNAALMTYVPPELRAWSGLAAEANPVVSMERAGTAANKARTSQGWDRVAALGDVASNVAGVVAPVAAAKGAGMPAVQALEEALLGMSAQPRAAVGQFAADESGALRLFHGSPHDFDKFSMDKIGTGEGAQAYGHGLYFAEAEDTALSYKNSLTRNSDELRRMAEETGGLSGDAAEMLSYQFSMNNFHGKGFDKWLDDIKTAYDADELSGRAKAAAEQIIAREVDASEAVRKMRAPGSMYEVNVNANPDDFLDWDKPLSEQPAAMRAVDALTQSPDVMTRLTAKTWRDYPPDSGERFIRALSGIADGGGSRFDSATNAAASEMLRDAGIPGIRYLDAGSRGAGDGSRNYVVFDENLIEIVRKYGIAGAATVLGVSQADIAQAMGVDATTGQPMAATPPRME